MPRQETTGEKEQRLTIRYGESLRCIVCGKRYRRWNGQDDQHCSRACYADHYGAYYDEDA